MTGMVWLNSFTRCWNSGRSFREGQRLEIETGRVPLRNKEFLGRIEDLNVVSGDSMTRPAIRRIEDRHQPR